MCTQDGQLNRDWKNEETEQTSRYEMWSDTKFVVCIFEEYLGAGNFTESAFDTCSNKPHSAADFYKFASPPGQLQEPTLDMSQVPTCDRTRAQSPETVTGLDGLRFLWKFDGCGTYNEVTINTPNAFNPVATEMGACSP